MEREGWLASLLRLGTPILEAACEGRLAAAMPIEAQPGQAEERARYAALEATGRLLAGMGPWLALDEVPPAEQVEEDWLRIGLFGHQPQLGEGYICTGSLYLASVAFLPMGLPSHRPFWSDPAEPWTSRRVTQGDDIPVDHALHGA